MTGSVCADFHSCSSISISSSCDTFSYSAIRHYIIKAVRRGGLFGILSKEFHVKRLLLGIFFVPLPAINKKEKNPDSSPAPECLGEELPGLRCKDRKIYGTDQTISGKSFFNEEDGAIFCAGLSPICPGVNGNAGMYRHRSIHSVAFATVFSTTNLSAGT